MAVAAPRTPSSPGAREPFSTRAVIAADRVIYRFASHWLLVANLLAFPLAVLPLVAAWLRATGGESVARPIDAFFATVCHQRDDRSFHIYGEKMACCHRCFAIYGGLFAAGLLFVYLRSVKPDVRPLRAFWAALLCAPIAVDGLGQLGGAWESTWYLRSASGLLFAVAISWFLLPFLDRGFARMRRDLELLFDRLVAQGRTRPLAN